MAGERVRLYLKISNSGNHRKGSNKLKKKKTAKTPQWCIGKESDKSLINRSHGEANRYHGVSGTPPTNLTFGEPATTATTTSSQTNALEEKLLQQQAWAQQN